ncbi:M15 family metallopeptidase [Patescibacteria group bacterium]
MDDLTNHIHDHKIHIPIKECEEPLEKFDENEFILEPIYFKWGHSNTDIMEARQGAIKRLTQAKKHLPENYNFKIWDGYRTLKVQQILYDDYYSRLKKEHPDFAHEKLCQMVEIFVSPASRNPKFPSPHNTGGAIDLTIVDENNQELNMGTPFDEFTERSFTNHFSNDPEGKIHKNRMMFKKIMEAAGFANYFEEWWHYSYGDQEWAKTRGESKALYGSVEL